MSDDRQKIPSGVVEEVELRGHIIDSLLLPKVLDRILQMGGQFEIRDYQIGMRRVDPSHAVIAVHAENEETLREIIGDLLQHGAVPVHPEDAQAQEADLPGCFPVEFYSTTNERTQVRVGGRWIDVADQEMDCGIVLDVEKPSARCLPMAHVTVGMPIVVGHQGVRVRPTERARGASGFGFMTSGVSSEKPKAVALATVADAMRRAREAGQAILLVGGPAIVHTGSNEHVTRLIRGGWVQALFAGNALATHDVEQALYGTSLGVSMSKGEPIEHGHEHHLRAINTIRRAGSMRQAVESGVLQSGIMYECVRANVEMVLAGSVRDDGPMPGVITDMLQAQDEMRRIIRRGVGFALCVATALHSIATGNLLPAWVPMACVDINPAIPTKLADRGSFQTISVVTDVEPFLRQLAANLCPGA